MHHEVENFLVNKKWLYDETSNCLVRKLYFSMIFYSFIALFIFIGILLVLFFLFSEELSVYEYFIMILLIPLSFVLKHYFDLVFNIFKDIDDKRIICLTGKFAVKNVSTAKIDYFILYDEEGRSLYFIRSFMEYKYFNNDSAVLKFRDYSLSFFPNSIIIANLNEKK